MTSSSDTEKIAIGDTGALTTPSGAGNADRTIELAGRLTHLGVWSVELPDYKLTVSDEVLAIHGIPPAGTLTVEKSINQYAPEYREIVTRAFNDCVQNGTPFDLEVQIVTVGDTRVWVRSVGEAIRDASGVIHRVEGAIQDISERRRAAAETRQLVERLTATLESITDAFFTLDREWRFIFLNTAAERLLQRPRADLIGRDWRTEFPAAVDSGFGREYRRAFAENQMVEFEEFSRRFNSWFSVRAYPSPEGLAVYFLDITESRRVSSLLAESRQRLVLATESAHIGIWDWDVVAGSMVWDKRMHELYGVREQDTGSAYDAWQDGLHPHDRNGHLAEMSSSLDGPRDFITDFRVVWPNGEVHELEVHGVVERAPDGSVVRMIGVSRDVTARTRSEREVECALQRLNDAQRIGQIGDWEYNPATGITWSPQVFKIFGRDPCHGPPRDLGDAGTMYEAKSSALMKEKVTLAISSGEAQQYELLVHRPDGEKVHVQVTASPTSDESGKVVSLRGTVQDISARKRAEQVIEDRVRQQELIAILGHTALANADLDNLFAEAASAMAKGLRVAFSRVLQWATRDCSFVLRAGDGWAQGWLGRSLPCADGGPRLAAVLSSGTPSIVDDFAGDLRTSASEILSAHGIASGVDIAIVCADGPWGVLGAYSHETRKFSHPDLDFLRSIANIVATGIDRQRRDLQMAHLAQYDLLTNLPNRMLFDDRLQASLAQSQRSGTRTAVLYLDLDRFKNVNDSFGHGVGDLLLQEVARRLTAPVRVSDTVSRRGGDEFLVLMPDLCCEEDTLEVLGRLIRSMAAPASIGGVDLTVGVSIGIACFPEDGQDDETLLRHADAAMYAAKEAGRNCCRFYSEETSGRAFDVNAALSQGGSWSGACVQTP